VFEPRGASWAARWERLEQLVGPEGLDDHAGRTA
jgi:hypothetical protein